VCLVIFYGWDKNPASFQRTNFATPRVAMLDEGDPIEDIRVALGHKEIANIERSFPKTA